MLPNTFFKYFQLTLSAQYHFTSFCRLQYNFVLYNLLIPDILNARDESWKIVLTKMFFLLLLLNYANLISIYRLSFVPFTWTMNLKLLQLSIAFVIYMFTIIIRKSWMFARRKIIYVYCMMSEVFIRSRPMI